MAIILAEVTNMPPAHWRRTIRASVAAAGKDIRRDTQLLAKLSRSEAERLLHGLRAEKAGILRWAVQGAAMARQMPPAARYRMGFHMANRQIAEAVGVTAPTVMATVKNLTDDQPEYVMSRDGRMRPAQQQPKPEPPISVFVPGSTVVIDHDAAAWLCQFAPEVVGKLVPAPEVVQGQLWG
jgi:hypothetical protein